jgi:hypothetical protein
LKAKNNYLGQNRFTSTTTTLPRHTKPFGIQFPNLGLRHSYLNHGTPKMHARHGDSPHVCTTNWVLYGLLKLVKYRSNNASCGQLPKLREGMFLYISRETTECACLLTRRNELLKNNFHPDSAWKRSSKTRMKLTSAKYTVENS